MNRVRAADCCDGLGNEQAMAEVFVGLEAQQTTAALPRETRQIFDGVGQIREMFQIRSCVTLPIAIGAVGVTNIKRTTENREMTVSDAFVGARLAQSVFGETFLAALWTLANIDQTLDMVIQ